MDLTPKQYILPDFLAMCPIDSTINPHYEKAAAESRAWIGGYDFFSSKSRAWLALGTIELLPAHSFSYAGYEQFRSCCDFVNLLYAFDELSDWQKGKDALAASRVLLNAMKDPTWDDCSVFCQMTKEFRLRFLRFSGPKSTTRFLKHWEIYCSSVAKEADLRERGEVLDVNSYIPLRRENSAVYLCFDMIEHCIGVDLPDEVYENSTFMDMYLTAIDLVCWSNDTISYDMEQVRGIHGNNILSVLMKHKDMTLQEAADYAGVYFKGLMDRFISAQARLPSWGPSIDSGLKSFIQGLWCWVRGNLDWSFESKRYFGVKHLEVKATRLVILQQHRENYASS